jgi:hypothetical protein
MKRIVNIGTYIKSNINQSLLRDTTIEYFLRNFVCHRMLGIFYYKGWVGFLPVRKSVENIEDYHSEISCIQDLDSIVLTEDYFATV